MLRQFIVKVSVLGYFPHIYSSTIVLYYSTIVLISNINYANLNLSHNTCRCADDIAHGVCVFVDEGVCSSGQLTVSLHKAALECTGISPWRRYRLQYRLST